MTMTSFEQAAEHALDILGSNALCALSDRLDAGCSPVVLVAEARPAHRDVVAELMDMLADGAPSYLRALARGYARHAAATSVETVWSGPSTHTVPVRSTLQVLLDVIADARVELLLMTYSATPHAGLRAALVAAVSRGVQVAVVVETLQGAGSAMNGAEPATAFAGVPGVALWHWPADQRREQGAKMHAKIAVADERVLLVSSANLTQAGVAKNIEAGSLIRGGDAPRRAAEHVRGLMAGNVVRRLSSTS